MRKARISVVDDDAEFLGLFTKAILAAVPQASLTTYPSGTDLLKALAESTPTTYPNLIIMDLDMPGPSGIQVAREIRNTPQFRFLPIVMLTQSDQPGDVHLAYENGVNAFIRKPFSYQELKVLAGSLSTYWFEAGQLPGKL